MNNIPQHVENTAHPRHTANLLYLTMLEIYESYIRDGVEPDKFRALHQFCSNLYMNGWIRDDHGRRLIRLINKLYLEFLPRKPKKVFHIERSGRDAK
jgi:hypothetical protein